ncbi:MAG: TonB-dependent receptor [Gammaproteobacteria bacterium]
MRCRTLCIGLALAVASALAQADEQKTNFDIRAQPLGVALRQLADQTGLQLAFQADIAAGRTSPPIKGSFTAREALEQLLQGSGLRFQFLDDHTVAVSRAGADSSPSSNAEASHRTGDASRPTGLRLAQTEPLKSDTGHQGSDASASARTTSGSVDEIVVTGSRLAVDTHGGPSPIITLTRDDIERSGRVTVADILQTVSAVANTTSNANTAVANGGNTTVQLRGLPPGSTLVLLNGRRTASASTIRGTFANLNQIPAAAIERIDIVPQGSSAVYGSDALGGVVNIVLKKGFDGFDVSTQYSRSDGIDQTTVAGSAGALWESGGASITASYSDSSALLGSERDITTNADHRNIGGLDRRVATCHPGNVYSTTSANLPGVGATQAAIPAGVSGTPTLADFAGQGGAVNLCSTSNQAFALLPSTKVRSIVASASHAFNPHVELFAEWLFSDMEQDLQSGYVNLTKVVVPASNAFNPFGVPVRVDYLFDRPEFYTGGLRDVKSSRPLAGVRGSLAGSWSYEVAGWYGKETADQNIRNQSRFSDTAALNAALASSNPATALNLFTTGAPASQAVLDGLFRDYPDTFGSRSTGVSAFVRGSLFDLPAGPLRMVVGAEHTTESISRDGLPEENADYNFDRHVNALFTELRAPLFATGDREVAALTGAVRNDDYSDFGRQTTTQFGAEWRPLDTLLVRASYSEAFKAPNLYAVYSAVSPTTLTVTDPLHGRQSTSVSALFGGNPALLPETGDSYSLGFAWRSVDSRFRSELSWWHTAIQNRVQQFPTAQQLVDNENLFPGRVLRAAGLGGQPGAITLVDYRAINFGELDASGVDVDVHVAQADGLGWYGSASATYTTKYDAALLPTTPKEDRIDRATADGWAPQLKGSAAVGWRTSSFATSFTGYYVSGYRDYSATPNGTYPRLGNAWTFDLNGKYRLNHFAPAWLAGATPSVGLTVVNLFDKQPQYSNFSSVGFDPTLIDIRGRTGVVTVNLRW